MGEFDDVIAEFLVESREGLDSLDRDLVELEDRPDDKDLLARIFRCFHTIKGTSGFLGFQKLEELTHAGENLLSKLRDGELLANSTITNALLESLDSVRYMLGEVEAGGNDGDGDYTAMTERLRQLCRGEGMEGDGAASEHHATPPPAEPQPAAAESGEEAAGVTEEIPMPAMEPRATIESRAPAEEIHHDVAPAQFQDLGVREALGDVLPAVAARADSDARPAAVVPENVRVDVHLLDNLVDLAGELVLTRNHIVQLAKGREDAALASATQRLNFVTAQLQDGIMRMRMQPVSTLFSKFPRVVRDLAKACRKQVRLDLDGRDTELDKSLIEAIKDPLTHLIRNCVDHGVEAPEVRVARGKPAEGRVILRAYHQNGLVHIEVADDGGGIAVSKVRNKAIARGLLTEERAQTLSDGEIANLIFLPGFSTADQVTNLSGRGVGMDVVKTNVEQVGGTVEVQSREGAGTTFTLKIPLTLAIVPALIVRCGGNRYAVPQVNVIELVRIVQGSDHQQLEYIHGAPVYRLRGKLLPIVFLEEALGGYVDHSVPSIPPANDNDDDGPSRFMAVVQASGRQFGLVVDAVLDQQEIVVKPLPKLLSETGAFAGATLLGDGRVALILDVLGIATRARLVSEMRDEGVLERRAAGIGGDTSRTLLLIRGANDTRLAVPLDQVSRLETIDPARIEAGGMHDVVQYRGDIMPLVMASDVLPELISRIRGGGSGGMGAAPPTGPLSVVVLGVAGRPLGLVVEDVLDVVEAPGELRQLGARTGVVGTVVVQERVTEVLDLEWIGTRALGAA
jgi:two-component system, chemotaxis family, sensor kinase CheA